MAALTAPALARALHGVIEPIHAILYFADEASRAWTDLGLEPRAQGYVAGRAAPMGRIGPAAAAAAFHNFNPALFEFCLPAVWDVASPDQVLAARAGAMESLFRRVEVPQTDLEELTDLAQRAADAVQTAGRPLAAANAAVPLPDAPLARIWQLLAVLREHRGDGHVALLVSSGISPVEALVLYATWQGTISRRFLQTSRLWDDEAWDGGVRALHDRGWLDPSQPEAVLTDAGQAAREDLEARTDVLAAGPYAALGTADALRLFDLLVPWVDAMNAAQAFKRPWPAPDRPA